MGLKQAAYKKNCWLIKDATLVDEAFQAFVEAVLHKLLHHIVQFTFTQNIDDHSI